MVACRCMFECECGCGCGCARVGVCHVEPSCGLWRGIEKRLHRAGLATQRHECAKT